MNKIKIGFFTILILFVIIVSLASVVYISRDTTPPESPEPPPYKGPYIKHWETLFTMTLTFSEDYYVLNYTLEADWNYFNLLSDTNQFEYPFVYAVSSDMFENFSRAVEYEYFDHYEDPILEKVYQFEIYSRYNIYGNFSVPYLDNWSIFICNNHCGPNTFTYHDAIFNYSYYTEREMK